MNNDLATANYLIQRRIYDVLARILANLNEDDANTLMRLHSQGVFVTPAPSYLATDEN